MWKGGFNHNSKNTLPLHISETYLKARKHNTITHEFQDSSQVEIQVLQEQGEHASEAYRLLQLGVQQQQAGELHLAMKSLQQSLALFQVAGDCQKQAQVFCCLALIAYNLGDYKGTISYS
ncbi:tetratricopeptide repeat protein, partial [Fischerella thermalis CCMEE 5328]